MTLKYNNLFMTGAIARLLSVTLLCGSIAAGVFAPPARAQQAGDADSLAEIVVTARRVAENIQKVPIEVVEVSGQALRESGVDRIEDLAATVPGFTAQPSYQSGAPIYTIRGQHGDPNPAPNTEPAVAVYFAGMIQSRSEGTNGAFFDIDSVQVLEGPQGTLFGRNSTAGAILITPRAPEETLGGYVAAGYGNYDDRTLKGVLNLPLSDKVALRIAAASTVRDGYIENVLSNSRGGGVDERSSRISLLLKPAEFLQSTFIGTYYTANTAGDMVKLAGEDPHFLYGNLAPNGLGFVANAFTTALAADAAHQASLGDYKVSDPNNPFSDDAVYSLQNNTDIQLNDHLQIKNIVGYREDRHNQTSDFAGSDLDYFFNGIDSKSQLLTEEPQLQGTFGKFNFITGAYFLREDVGLQAFDRIFGSLPGFASANISPFLGAALGAALPARDSYINSYTTRSYSGFFHSTYDLSSLANGLSVAAGVRLSHDIKTADLHGFNVSGVTPAQNGFICEEGPNAGVTYSYANIDACRDHQRIASTLPSWNASVNYQLTENLLLYTGISHAYRAGGFDISQQIPTQQHFGPEFITEYELGEKAEFNLGRVPVRLNASGYYGIYHDIQHLVGVPSAAGGVSDATFNVAAANLYGGELDLTFKPINDLQVRATYAYSREQITSWTLPYRTLFASSAGPAGTVVQLDNSDSAFSYIPTNQYSITGRYEVPLPDPYGVIAMSATWYGQSSMFASDDSTANCGPDGYFTACYSRDGRVPGYTLLNLHADWKNVAGLGFNLTLFCNNALDKLYKSSVFDLRGTVGISSYVYGPPRMFGLEIAIPFGSEAK